MLNAICRFTRYHSLYVCVCMFGWIGVSFFINFLVLFRSLTQSIQSFNDAVGLCACWMRRWIIETFSILRLVLFMFYASTMSIFSKISMRWFPISCHRDRLTVGIFHTLNFVKVLPIRFMGENISGNRMMNRRMKRRKMWKGERNKTKKAHTHTTGTGWVNQVKSQNIMS